MNILLKCLPASFYCALARVDLHVCRLLMVFFIVFFSSPTVRAYKARANGFNITEALMISTLNE